MSTLASRGVSNASRWRSSSRSVAKEALHVAVREHPTREPLGDIDRQALPAELIHNRDHPERAAIGGAIRHEAIAPDVIAMRRPQADAPNRH
jgi:hypothetical protein